MARFPPFSPFFTIVPFGFGGVARSLLQALFLIDRLLSFKIGIR